MPYKIVAAVLGGLLYTQLSFAHGEGELGPNKGYIRMPGGFHTEVVPTGKNFKVFLLDIEFKNPTVANSTVEFVLIQNKKEIKNSCSSEMDHFSCALPKDVSLKSGVLQIKASRNGVTGGIAEYKLPLALAKHH